NNENRLVLMYINENKSSEILFNYILNVRKKDIFSRVQLQGLDAQKKYRFKEINLFPGAQPNNPDNDKVFTGEYLMTVGLNLAPGRITSLTSNVFEITEE